MSTRNKNPTKYDIEKRIYKIFTNLSSQDTVKVSEFLKRLKLEMPLNIRLTFSNTSMTKAMIFMRLKGIRFQTQLVSYLIGHEEDALNLGFCRGESNEILVPDQRTFSYFVKHRLTEERMELIDFIVRKTEEIAEKFGIIFDVETVKAEKPIKSGTDKTFYNRKDRKIRELCKFTKKKFYPHVKLDLCHNAVYTKNNFLDLLVHMAMTKDFTENGSKTLRVVKPEKSPTADALLYHVKKYNDMEELQRMFMKVFDVMYKILKSSNILNNRRVDVAIDFTDWFYYGDKNDPMVVRKKPESGTDKCFRFASVNILEAGERITLLALPVGVFSKKKDIVEKLVNYAKGKVRIRKIYVDRGFFSVEMVNLLKRHKLIFMMPAIKNRRVIRFAKTMPAPSVIKDYTMASDKSKATFNLVILEGENREKKKVKQAFATNMDVNEKEVGLTERLFRLYSKRWGIETSYRMKKGFRAKTTSKNYIVRLFYFLFSSLLYNLWIIIDSLIALSLFGKLIKDHVVTSKLFGTILCMIPYVT